MVSLQINGLHFDTKNIIYAYSIVEISLKNYIFYYFYHFYDITAANHKIDDTFTTHVMRRKLLHGFAELKHHGCTVGFFPFYCKGCALL